MLTRNESWISQSMGLVYKEFAQPSFSVSFFFYLSSVCCEWLYCVCWGVKVEQLVRKGSRSGWKCISWMTNRALIIFILDCSCFSKSSGQSNPCFAVARKKSEGKIVFLHLEWKMNIERRPRNVGWRLNGRHCSIFHELMCSLCRLFYSAPALEAVGGKGEAVSVVHSRMVPPPTPKDECEQKKWPIVGLSFGGGGQGKKITACVGGQSEAVVGCWHRVRNRFRTLHRVKPPACSFCK